MAVNLLLKFLNELRKKTSGSAFHFMTLCNKFNISIIQEHIISYWPTI